ncbi:MAG: CDP-alcohol phosphatidyltransferase family protein [Actinobacteria bacterium]|nr:CDP-alcohol phosphatidyltransferase family protein [Actinomycetota bacterium]
MSRFGRPRQVPRDFSLALHAFTASGVLVGMAALVAVLDGSARLAIIWLLVAQVIDGIDGPLARRLLPEEASTRFDGCVLDLVIDFVTCVLVPAAFLWQFGVVPNDRYGMLVVAMMLLSSSLWFSRTDQLSDDGWFRGFPSAWNMVIPTLWLLGGSQWSSSVVIVVLSLLTLTNIEFAHPVRAATGRLWNLASMTVWIWSVVAGVATSPDLPVGVRWAVLVGPMMVAISAVWHAVTSATDEAYAEH